MKSEDIGNFTLLARTAFAIMCFEKYVISVYPHIDYRPVAEMMWHIVDGSDYLDEAAYKYAEIIPDSLFEYDSFESLDYQYMTKEQYVLFSNILNPQDRDLNRLMEAIYNIAMSYCYTSVSPGAPDTIPYLHEAIDVLEKHNIDLPDISLLSNHSISSGSLNAYRNFNWMGEIIDPKELSIILK